MTEDCDLGIRLYRRGYKTRILDSVTWEEASSSLKGWLRQRSRWVKGYIQTYFVHTRKLKNLRSEFSNAYILAFQLLIAGTPLSMLINPIMWTLTIIYFSFRSTLGNGIESIFPPTIYYVAVFGLVFGNFLFVLYYILGVARRNDWGMVKWFFLASFYWLLMSVGAWIALLQLLFKPFHWEKTSHGHSNGISLGDHVMGTPNVKESILSVLALTKN